MKDFDGIVSDGEAGYFLTTVENSGFYHMDKEMNVVTLLEEDAYFGDLEFDRQQNKIYIPRGNKNTNQYFISVFDMKKK